MKKKNTRAVILVIILLGLIVFAFKSIFVSEEVSPEIEQNIAASARVEEILAQVQAISFDLSVLHDPKFESLKSLETPLPNLPVGKANPFSTSLNSR